MNPKLLEKHIAILAADGFEQTELTGPREALTTASAKTSIVSPCEDKIQGMHHMEKGDTFAVDIPLDHADVEDFDALVIPGGLYNPDTLRSTPEAVEFVRAFARAGKPIAAICHGPWLLAEAGLAEGRTLTSWPAIRSDLENAGATWTDQEVVVDDGIVTSRTPDDIPAFNRKLIEEISEGRHAALAASV